MRFSNKTKIYWPGTDITKGDLVAHYEAIAGYLIPHLEGRPVHMHRFPGGIDGKHFYQRHAPAHLPDWIDTVVIESGDDSEHFVMCNNRESLLYLINLGSIDLHPWMARADSPDAPNWSIIDIDAKQSYFKTAVKAAREVGKVLSGISMVSCVKTSGGDGIHIGIPLEPDYSFAQSRMLAETICRVVAMQNSKSTTVERNPSKRGRRVYLDYLQNAKGQTVVAPFVVRPRPGAPVSMPILWDELDSDSSPTDFNIRNAAERVAQTGDLFRSVLDKPQSIDGPIENLESYVASMKK